MAELQTIENSTQMPVFLPERAVSYRIDLRVIASGQARAATEGV